MAAAGPLPGAGAPWLVAQFPAPLRGTSYRRPVRLRSAAWIRRSTSSG